MCVFVCGCGCVCRAKVASTVLKVSAREFGDWRKRGNCVFVFALDVWRTIGLGDLGVMLSVRHADKSESVA